MRLRNDLRPEAAVRWLDKAKRDLDTAVLNNRHDGYTDVSCYFSHQTVEKSLKAFLVHHSIRFQKIHHLPKLLKMCEDKDSEFSAFKKQCRVLNDYFLESKYPMDIPIVYTKKEAREAIQSAEKVFEFVKKKLCF